MKNACAVELEHVWTRFGEQWVHQDISFCLEEGEILGLVGASGSGKTTLLREMIGLEMPCRGDLKVLGEPVQEACAIECRQRRSHAGVLFQNGALFSSMNIFENIAFPMSELGIDDEGLIRQMVCMKLAMVGLKAHDAMLKPSELSGAW